MTALSNRTRLLVALLAVSTVALVLVAASGAAPALFADDSDSPDRPDDPTTADTVGYVDGYWYDDDLPVDDRDTAAVDDDELEAVVARAMARVEVIRETTFDGDVPVEVVSREEYRSEHDVFVDLTAEERLQQNVTFEALFMVDNETDAAAELETMYGGAVDGYYEPSTDRIVVVSDSPERPELDETVLGHELVHALQDQRYDLSDYERETIDGDNGKNGLVEGEARWVDLEYEDRCEAEWDCVRPDDPRPEEPPGINWGLYLTLYQPYSDGPDYVEHLRETGGWTAVDAAYEAPPESSSTVIHREERPPADVSVPDHSNESWDRLAGDTAVATERPGEAAMVAMFGADALDPTASSVIESRALLGDGPLGFDYDQPYTDGWAGDELVTYVRADAGADAGADTASDTGYVWRSEWRSSEDAREFASGYLELLALHDAEPVDDRRDTYVIDEAFPGAYYIERDDETVTIVRAPSVDALDAVADGAAPRGNDTVERIPVTDTGEETTTAESDSIDGAGFAVSVAVIAGSIAVLAVRRWTGP